MRLVIDNGNTHTLFAVHDGTDWVAQWRMQTNVARTADEYAVWLAQLLALEGLSFATIDACVICTVVPQSLLTMRDLVQRYFEVDPIIIGAPGVDMNIKVRGVDKPSEIGADRLATALAGLRSYEGNLIIIDCGTATTFDIVSQAGYFEGGIIAPGINLSMQALYEAAAQLPHITITRPEKVIGCDTVSAMQSGIFWGYVSMIDGLVERIKAEDGRDFTVIGTGGVVTLMEGMSRTITHYDNCLIMNGLLEIWRLNRPDETHG